VLEAKICPVVAALPDLSDDASVNEATKIAAEQYKAGRPVILIGWSRGAIKALKVAQNLNQLGIPVQYLGLIDPVGTAYRGYKPEIPENVQMAFRSFKDKKHNDEGTWWLRNEPITTNSTTTALTQFEFAGFHTTDSAGTINDMVRDAKKRGVPLP
jgi:hypothetical protein